jgi:Spx/MgsR family transcriptional regulator
LRELGAELQERDFGKDPLSESELQTLIGDADIAAYLNTRTSLYRAQNMKANPPTKAQAIKLMVQDPNLIKRPIIVMGQTRVLGFDADKLRALVTAR